MRFSRLREETATAEALIPREVSVSLPAGSVLLAHYPVASTDRELPTHDLLNRYLTNWNVTSDDGDHLPLNADALMALKPEIKDAFREAILARPKAKSADRPEKAPEKPAEPAHGSFVAADEKEQTKSIHGPK